ncbi:MAG: hypothetical protein U9Q91_02440 [Candidatus Marinimicrobia bacterium]|nr:hypothetical protein [Candidatus Neomarinimicrobiota bacterium]
MKTKAISSIMFVLALMLISCLDQESVYHSFTIDINTFADEFGDENGAASTDELAALSEYFQENNKAYFLAGSLNEYIVPLNSNELQSDFFMNSQLYPSETDMRNDFEGEAIRTPWVAIYVAALNSDEIVITHIYRAPGPHIFDGSWERVEVE